MSSGSHQHAHVLSCLTALLGGKSRSIQQGHSVSLVQTSGILYLCLLLSLLEKGQQIIFDAEQSCFPGSPGRVHDWEDSSSP